jgi:cytidylate kinase
MKRLIIAVDGPVGSGKSTVARRVAELLGYTYLDSGAMYRALALKALQHSVAFDSCSSAAKLEMMARETSIELRPLANGLHVLLDGMDVTSEIREPRVSLAASRVALVPGVRSVLVAKQQEAGSAGGVVMEGRDIGTVVFPHADLKIFLEATVEVRGARRWREHQLQGDEITLAQTIEEVRERDRRDRTREVSPLVQAADAVLVDNTAMDIEETARLIVFLAQEKMRAGTQSTTSGV